MKTLCSGVVELNTKQLTCLDDLSTTWTTNTLPQPRDSSSAAVLQVTTPRSRTSAAHYAITSHVQTYDTLILS